jgi:menaquinone reductase, molybdopterin-binding-like subunit
MKRREFIILSGIGATSASLLSACGHPEEKLIPALIPDEEFVPGIDYWKASTCGMCSAGCGIVVRTREHKANKIEGNPLHPVNRGALCARGQAGLQVLYNPDRIKAPMKRVGERGEGKWQEISWDEAIKTIATRLSEIKAQGQTNRIMFATNDIDGVTGSAIKTLISAYGMPVLLSTDSPKGLYETGRYQISYGGSYTPTFDIANATYLLSFGARFLETWHSPVKYSLAYGEFRQTRGKARGKFVQIEPRMSLTGANADEWLPATPGTEGSVALSIAQVIVREKLIKDTPSYNLGTGSLDDYSPEKTRELTGIEPEKIIRLAREFAGSERPLAISRGPFGGLGGDSLAFMATNSLNTLCGNINKPGGVLLSSFTYFDLASKVLPKVPHVSQVKPDVSRDVTPSYDDASLLRSDRSFSALFTHQMNPIYSYPRSIDTIKAIPFIVSCSPFLDETAAMADIVLPDQTFLESWNFKAIPLIEKRVAISITQPTVKSEVNSKQAADVLLALSRELGGAANIFESAEDIVRQVVTANVISRDAIKTDAKETGGTGGDNDTFKEISDRGFWGGEVEGLTVDYKSPSEIPIYLKPTNESDEIKRDLPFILLAYEHPALGFGEHANLPALQELPDSMTSAIWGSWVEINPKTAASLGIADGDLVEVSSDHGSVRAPAVLYPAIRPEVVAMPYGQGHTAYGRYAKDKGANPIVVNPFAANSDTSAIRVKIAKISGDGKLIRFGTTLNERNEVKR